MIFLKRLKRNGERRILILELILGTANHLQP